MAVPVSEVMLTEKIRRWIRTVLTHSDLANETREELIKYSPGRRTPEEKRPRTIPFELVKTLQHHLESDQGGLYLHELLEGSDVALHEPQLPPRSPELEARIRKLKDQQENREYMEMVSNIEQKPRDQVDYVSSELKVMNNQLIAVFNFLVTVIGAFVFMYKAIEYASEVPNFVTQVIGGLIAGTIVFIADLYFLIKYHS